MQLPQGDTESNAKDRHQTEKGAKRERKLNKRYPNKYMFSWLTITYS